MALTDIAHYSHALKFGSQKINLHLSGHEFEPKAARVQVGSGDLCFITECSVDEVLLGWRGGGVEVSVIHRSLGEWTSMCPAWLTRMIGFGGFESR
jgi:hypothetical protein